MPNCQGCLLGKQGEATGKRAVSWAGAVSRELGSIEAALALS